MFSVLGVVASLWPRAGSWDAVVQVERALGSLADAPPHWLYGAIALGVVIENFFPPIPADTFVLLGAFLSAEGRVTGVGVFAVTWSANTAAALLNYGLARRWGRAVIDTPPGRWLLRPRQLERLAVLYRSHGAKIIFFSRFLPAFRVLVPVFAGVSRLPLSRTAPSIALASAIWYGVLVVAGTLFGRNWPLINRALAGVNSVLLAVAAVIAAATFVIWWKTRRASRDDENAG